MNKIVEVIHGHVSSDLLKDDGVFPNNAKLPLLIYKGALHLHPDDEPESVIELFKSHEWSNAWKDSILQEHHYHSNTHEVMGIFCGKADLQLGGPVEGVCVELVRGDVLIIPAGMAHKNLSASRDFLCVGAYPDGMSYDMNYGKEGEGPQVLENIKNVPIPKTDPVFGTQGPLTEHWKA